VQFQAFHVLGALSVRTVVMHVTNSSTFAKKLDIGRD